MSNKFKHKQGSHAQHEPGGDSEPEGGDSVVGDSPTGVGREGRAGGGRGNLGSYAERA